MSFVINRADGSQRTVSGYTYAAPQPGVKKYGASIKNLPPRVDLRPGLTPVENQGQTNSCVANAVAGAYEYLVKRHLGDDSYDVSRLFIYYNARTLQNGQRVRDSGSRIYDAIESLKQYGACSEATWTFEEDAVNEEPAEEAYAEAANFLVEDVEVVPVALNAWKSCLAEGYPVIFGLELFNSFDQHRKKGLVPMPTAKEAERAEHSGHAMLCVGYSDKDRVFIVRNSWGKNWGDQGYCYIPYDYLMNKKYNLGDSWRIKRLDNLDFDQETWTDDAESLLGDYDTELASMSDAEYNALLDAMGDYPLEYRIGLLFLTAANADNDLSEAEYDEIADYLKETLEKLGSALHAKKVLKHCLKSLDDEDLLTETMTLFGEHLSNEMLARILSDLQAVVGIDELSEDEEDFIYRLMEEWQLGEDEEDDDDEDEDDDEEEEDEEEDEDEKEERRPRRRR